MREPGGLPSMGLHLVRHDWSDLAAADNNKITHESKKTHKQKNQENKQKQTQTATIKQNSTKVKESLNTESVYVTNHLNPLCLEESCVLKEGKFNKINNAWTWSLHI